MPLESSLEVALARALEANLLQLRDKTGASQERIAERAGISRNHYQLLESGLSDRAKNSPANPRLSTLLDLARALNCTVGDLVDGLDRAS